MKEYMTIKEASEKWGIGIRRINMLCHEDRIEGCVKFGASWAIPSDAKKPEDKRIKSGQYIRKKTVSQPGEDALQVEYDISCADFSIPTLTLEPLVENALCRSVGEHL